MALAASAAADAFAEAAAAETAAAAEAAFQYMQGAGIRTRDSLTQKGVLPKS